MGFDRVPWGGVFEKDLGGSMSDQFGKMIVVAGAVLIVVGLVITFFDRIPLLGKLPGESLPLVRSHELALREDVSLYRLL